MPYTPSEHNIGHGKKLEFSDASNFSSPTQIFGTVSVPLPERELGASEKTNDDSPDYHKEYQPGLYEPGTVDFTYNYAKTEFEKVETLFALAQVAATRASATKYWRLTLPDGSTAVWQGFITANNLPAEQEDTLVCEASMQVTGKMTFTKYVPAST
jgi:hypothetical protein